MESDDDVMQDAESVEDYYYSGGDDGGSDDDDVDAAADYDLMGDDSDDSDQPVSRNQKNYIVLNEEDICQRQEEDITTISTVLSVSRETACLLLRHYNWNVSDVHEEWFADEEKVRKAVGLLDNPTVQLSNVKNVMCGVCFESYPLDRINKVACGHPFCQTCWKGLGFYPLLFWY